MSNSQRISQFNSTTIDDNSLITFVSNGQNFNISFSDFKGALGVTGKLCQAGNPLAVPVYFKESSGVVGIRNIEGSKGVKAAISANNGIVIGSNFEQPASGHKVIDSLNATKYKFKSFIAGDGVSIESDSDNITISADENTASAALAAVDDNSSETVISGADTPTKATGTWTDEKSEDFTVDPNGRCTYIGTTVKYLTIDLVATLLMATGLATPCFVYIAVNGNIVASTRVTLSVSALLSATVNTIWGRSFTNGDYIEVFVANELNVANIILQRAVLRIG